MTVTPLERSIILTVAYTHQFSYPLTLFEIYSRLISPTGSSPVQKKSFVAAVTQLLSHKRIVREKNYFLLTSGIAQEQVQHREQRLLFSKKKINDLQPLLAFLSTLPWVTAVGITGSVAMHNADRHDDTDILMIVQPYSLWLLRPLVILFAWYHQKRRSWDTEESNSWCFNLWLETTQLKIPTRQHSLYTAYEVAQVQWVMDKCCIEKKFLQSNAWIYKYIPVCFKKKYGVFVTCENRALLTRLLLVLHAVWVIPLNSILYLLQWWYMLPHMTREKVHLSSAFFHPRNTRGIITDRWKQTLKNLTH